MVPGESLSALIQVGLKARQKLGEAHGKIYEDERTRILELSDFNLKLIVEQARLAMLVYKAALKRYEEEVQHDLRVQEIDQELLIEAEETGVAALRLLKEQVRRALKEYENDVRGQVLALKLLHDEGKIDLNLLRRGQRGRSRRSEHQAGKQSHWETIRREAMNDRHAARAREIEAMRDHNAAIIAGAPGPSARQLRDAAEAAFP